LLGNLAQRPELRGREEERRTIGNLEQDHAVGMRPEPGQDIDQGLIERDNDRGLAPWVLEEWHEREQSSP